MRILFLLLLIMLSSEFILSQEIVWEYIVEDGLNNNPWGMNLGDANDLYINISNPAPRSSDGTYSAYNRVYLMRLDLDGNFKSTLFVKGCKNRVSLFPYGKNRFLSYGHNCIKNKYGKFSYDTRLFNRKGKLKKIGDPLTGNRFASYLDEHGLTFFSRRLGHYSATRVYYGHLNHNLEMTSDSMDLSSIMLDGYKLSFGSPKPLINNGWVVPFRHGILEGRGKNTLNPQFGGYAIVANNKVSSIYLPDRKYYFIEFLGYDQGEICALYRNINRSDNTFLFIDEEGNAVSEFCVELKRSGRIRLLKYKNEVISVMTDQSIIKFNKLGDKIMEYIFPDDMFDRNNGFIELENGDFILSGRKDKKTKIVRIGKSDAIIHKSQIEYANVSEVPKDVSAVIVYPNPTSDFITIEISYTDNPKIENCRAEIFTVSGRKVMTIEDNLPLVTFQVTDLLPGTYFYKVITKSNETFTGKFIKL